MLLRNNDNAVLIGHNYVVRPHRHTIAIHGNVNPGKAIMANRCGWNWAGGIDRKADALELRNIANPSVNDRAGETPRKHGASHQAAHARDVRSIFYLHHIN